MKIATILFTYNRSIHTECVLNALHNNKDLPEKLFIFQDGLKNKEHEIEWKKVNKLIKNVKWCDCEAIVSDLNKGLARSIVEGINFVLTKYDAIIVLEDDCVVHPLFMTYMYKCLSQYEFCKKVFSISGCSWGVEVEPNGTCAYFAGRISSWGWATWSDRWKYYEQDYMILPKMKKDMQLADALAIWGGDLESMLLGNIKGTCNSWAVFWALKVIEQGGFVVTPYRSLVQNIGMDGTGIHCGEADYDQHLLSLGETIDLNLPDIVKFPNKYEVTFKTLFFRSTTEERLKLYNGLLIKWLNMYESKKDIAEYLLMHGISRISIWGKGNICELLIKAVKEQVKILSIILSRPEKGKYLDIPLVSVNNIPIETQLIIVVPIHAMDQIREYARCYTRCNIISIEQLFEGINNNLDI